MQGKSEGRQHGVQAHAGGVTAWRWAERMPLLGSFQLPMTSLPQFHTQFDTQFLDFPSDPSFPSLYPSFTQFGPVSLTKSKLDL